MPRTDQDIDAPAFNIDGRIHDRQLRGGIMLLVDDDGDALTVADGRNRRLATFDDLRAFVRSGRAFAASGIGRDPARPLRGVRCVPSASQQVGDLAGLTPAAAAADEALTLGAFIHLSDAATDALGGYEVYLRALAGLRRRHRRPDLATATPTAFRRRVAEVGEALEASATDEGEQGPTIH